MKKLGFGAMRLPLIDKTDQTSINQEELNKMIDKFMKEGFTYFDTAYPYHKGTSEVALKEGLVKRYPRESFQLADKLPLFFLKKEEQMEIFFNEQLERCGVEYFDYYLLHNVCTWTENAFTKIDSFKFVSDKKAEGKIKNVGFSTHDSPELLEEVLKEHAADVDFIQLQINYIDWENKGIQSKKCYEIAQKYNKPVIVMEPVKGGTLIDIPEEAEKLFKNYNSDASNVSWALRFCESLDDVMIVLSGMSNYEQLEENLEIFNTSNPLNDNEFEIIAKVSDIINNSIEIPCTECGYCLEGCPKNILIPKFFALYNAEKQFPSTSFSSEQSYYNTYTIKKDVGKASDCIECGQCVKICPQHLKIPDLLKDVAQLFEN